jgi:hypothetical protein
MVIPVARHAENPCAVPDRVRVQTVGGVAVVKIPLFPLKLYIDFAAQVSQVFNSQLKSVERPLAREPSGGVGCLRLMSVLTSGTELICFSVGRRAAEPGYDRARLAALEGFPMRRWKFIGSP